MKATLKAFGYKDETSVVSVLSTGTKIIPVWALLILVPVLELEL